MLLDAIRRRRNLLPTAVEFYTVVVFHSVPAENIQRGTKEQILGGYEIGTDKDGNVSEVYKPGFIQRIWSMTSDKFRFPLSGLIGVAGIIFLAWGCIKLWAVFRIEKARVRIKEDQLFQNSKRENE